LYRVHDSGGGVAFALVVEDFGLLSARVVFVGRSCDRLREVQHAFAADDDVWGLLSRDPRGAALFAVERWIGRRPS
jgi:hypothetical protein